MANVSRLLPTDPDRNRQRKSLNRSQISFLAATIFCTYPFLVVGHNPAAGTSSTCRRDDAVDLIRQQIIVSKTLDDSGQRIALLIRAADLLWPVDRERARAAFAEAFEVATESEQANLAKPVKNLISFMGDQRYVVIRAVAKRQPEWAKALIKNAAEQDKQAAEELVVKDPRRPVVTAEKLLNSAITLLGVDMKTAMHLAVTSLSYPANSELTRFLYELAKVNQIAADGLYQKALVTYSDKPMREFLYLQAYPFAFGYGGDMPVFGFYQVAGNFRPNPLLQRQFVQNLIRRAELAMEVPLDDGDNYNWLPGTAHILQVLIRVEPYVGKSNPDLSEPLAQVRQRLTVSLPLETQKTLIENRESDTTPGKTFEDGLEAAQKLSDLNKREEFSVQAILNATDDEPIEDVVRGIDKVSDSNIRAILNDWLYFTRGVAAVQRKQVNEAAKWAARIGDIEPRAYLYLQIAKRSLAMPVSDINGRDMLELAITQAQKSPRTISTARTLLSATEVYLKNDVGRAMEVLRSAIEVTNGVARPDFAADDQTLVKEIHGHGWLRYARFYMPGLDPQAAFNSLAKIDLDGALSQANTFTDKLLRALTTLSVADVCLQQPQRPRQKNQNKANVRKISSWEG